MLPFPTFPKLRYFIVSYLIVADISYFQIDFISVTISHGDVGKGLVAPGDGEVRTAVDMANTANVWTNGREEKLDEK